MEDFAAFARLVDALRPWLGHLVIVGGWAHRHEVTDTIREAARIPQDRQLTPEGVRAVCEYGLNEILGSLS